MIEDPTIQMCEEPVNLFIFSKDFDITILLYKDIHVYRIEKH